jgi:hypothetical protein
LLLYVLSLGTFNYVTNAYYDGTIIYNNPVQWILIIWYKNKKTVCAAIFFNYYVTKIHVYFYMTLSKELKDLEKWHLCIVYHPKLCIRKEHVSTYWIYWKEIDSKKLFAVWEIIKIIGCNSTRALKWSIFNTKAVLDNSECHFDSTY